MHLCTSVKKEGGDGEGEDTEEPSLLSYTLRYFSLTELGNVCQVGFREPMYLCTRVSKEGGHGEGAGTEAPSLLSYTLRYVSLAELGNVLNTSICFSTLLCNTLYCVFSFSFFFGKGVSEQGANLSACSQSWGQLSWNRTT